MLIVKNFLLQTKNRMLIVRRSTKTVQQNFQKSGLLPSVNVNISSSAHPMGPPTPITHNSGSPPSLSPNSSSSSSSSGGTQGFDFQFLLSPENKSRTIKLLTLDKDNFSSRLKGVTTEECRKAAVLIPLCHDDNGKVCLLYNLRSQNLSKHKGEISFPGGAMDPEDGGSPIKAALRETHEELGIHPQNIEVWTTLRLFPTVSTNLGVVPVLGFIKCPVKAKELTVNPAEVDHAFTVSLEHLCDSGNWEVGPKRKFQGVTIHMPMWKNLNVFSGTDEIYLWGLTAFITHVALLALVPSEAYGRKLPYLKLQLKSRNNSGSESSCTSDKEDEGDRKSKL